MEGEIVPARGPPSFGWDLVFEAEYTDFDVRRLFHLFIFDTVPADIKS